MTNSINVQLTCVSSVLDGVVADARAIDALRARTAVINANLGSASHGLESGSNRITNALESMDESGTKLRVAEARLAFQSARLKRSTKEIRVSLDRLKAAGTILDQRAREARAVAETADRTATLIAAIEAAAVRGESLDNLLDAANDITAGSVQRWQAI